MKRILFLFTGGTISMRFDPEIGAAVPVLSGEEILSFVPDLDRLTSFKILDFARLPGPHVTPEKMLALSQVLERELSCADLCGAVITHGTDTLEETAYLLDLRWKSAKPVVVVGAMRNSSELGWDGPVNLKAAVRVVLDDLAANRGVLVVFNDKIHAASEVTKTHTESLDTFRSPEFGPLGLVDKDRIIWSRCLSRRQTISAASLQLRVDLIKMVAGADGAFVDYAVERGASGIVIEGTGRGNVPPDVVPAIQRALDKGIPVVIASRCLEGRVLDTYGYVGSGKDLRRRGVIFAGFLPGQKARIKLMLTLGATRNPAEIRQIMEEGMY